MALDGAAAEAGGDLGAPHWYIYYKLPQAELPSALATARGLQAVLSRRWPGLVCALYWRPGAGDGAVTLMETYTGTGLPADFAACLSQAASAHGADRWPRHLECFWPVGADARLPEPHGASPAPPQRD